MRKNRFILAVLTLALIIVLAFSACDMGNGGGGSTEDSAAAQLAAEINAIQAGSATAEGDTVKLTGGYVCIPRDLTVPVGVTLDVTADGAALVLGEGGRGGLYDVTLTVNGTVIAGPNAVRLEDNAIAPTINGSGTIRLKSKGHLLSVQGNFNVSHTKITLDGVTLVGLEDNSEALVGVGIGGEFVMKSGVITGNTHAGSDWVNGGGVEIWEGGIFSMDGGEISGNTAKGGNGARGGGVGISLGIFNMTGGEISGNTAESSNGATGGGVDIGGGTLALRGGTISGNTAKDGGGVAVRQNSQFTMTRYAPDGGAISGNTATGDGGGVWIDQSRFELRGGRIQGSADSDGFAKNTADGSYAALSLNSPVSAKWGGEWAPDSTFTKGGVPQTAGSAIDSTDDTLIAKEVW